MDDEQLGPDAQDDERDERDDGDDRDRGAGRLTTTIPRPANRRASDAGRSRLGRRRGKGSDRISGRRLGWVFGLAAVVVAGAIAAALFVLPVRTWFDQDRQIGALENELDEMRSVNDDLTSEVGRLQTNDGIIEAAREELGQMQADEHRQTMLAAPELPRQMPAGWPYSQVDQILLVQEHAAIAAASEAATGDEAPGGGADHQGGAGGFQPVAGPATQAPSPTTTTSPTTTPPTTTIPAAAGGPTSAAPTAAGG